MKSVKPEAQGTVLARIAKSVRVNDWWDYKVSSILAVFAATALELDVTVASLWREALLLLLGIGCAAIFASLVNDLTDVRADTVAGKANRLASMPRAWPFAMLAVTGIVGGSLTWAWRKDPLVVLPFAGLWLVFTAYSVPPLRLKERGGFGVIAMGFGEAALPSFVAAALCTEAASAPVHPGWLAVVLIWSFCHGERAILWHQLCDAEADSKAQISTFVQRRGVNTVQALAKALIMPIELAALVAMLILMRSWIPAGALAVYALTLAMGRRFWQRVPVVVTPLPRHVLLLQDYYIAYLPLAILSALALRRGADILTLAIFVALFPVPVLRSLGQAIRLGRQGAYWLGATLSRRIPRGWRPHRH